MLRDPMMWLFRGAEMSNFAVNLRSSILSDTTISVHELNSGLNARLLPQLGFNLSITCEALVKVVDDAPG